VRGAKWRKQSARIFAPAKTAEDDDDDEDEDEEDSEGC
jgi:hypothetical protein